MDRTIAFELTGVMPALIHADDVMASDTRSEWQHDPRNKGVSVAGDDRSPPWSWQTYLYHDGQNLVLPQENMMACLRKAAERIPHKRGSFKALSQVGLIPAGDNFQLLGNGQTIALAPIAAISELSFVDQKKAVEKMGFDLLVKRAKVGQSKHVRVRLMIRSWSARGVLTVAEKAITDSVLQQMFETAGKYVGLFDWRPSSPKSAGPYGTFQAKLSVAGA